MKKIENIQIPSSLKKTKGLLRNQKVTNGMEIDSEIKSPSNLCAVC